ncbi:MAG: hypothetical protein RLZZ453_93 [Chlamydiota bacterium]
MNYVGIGMVFPVFSPLLFSPSSSLLPPDTSPEMRGMWLGILIALMPVAQFFSSPLFGALSDNKGRRNPLIFTVMIGIIGYLISAWSLMIESFTWLIVSRLLIGIAAGSTAIIQASIADISSKEEKPKRYSLFSMAMGAGFTCGPMLGGLFSGNGYDLPFCIAAGFLAVTVLLLFFYFKETLPYRQAVKIHWMLGITQIKRAFAFKGLRTILFCSFIGVFGWCYFFELIPVFLIQRFAFSAWDLGLFSGASGAFYALSTGLLIRPLINRFRPDLLFFWSMILTGIAIFGMAFVTNAFWLFPSILLVCYLTAPFSPTSTTLVSNGVPEKIQGEALGILSSITAAAYALSPLLSGTFVGKYPESAMWIGGSTMFLGGLIGIVLFYYKKTNN